MMGLVPYYLFCLGLPSVSSPPTTKAAQRDTFLEVHYLRQGSRTLQLLFEQSEN